MLWKTRASFTTVGECLVDQLKGRSYIFVFLNKMQTAFESRNLALELSSVVSEVIAVGFEPMWVPLLVLSAHLLPHAQVFVHAVPNAREYGHRILC